MDTKNTLYVECECGCGILNFTRFDDDNFIYLNYYSSAFYEMQHGIWDKFKHRIKYIWYAILGKDFRYYEIVLSPEKIKELQEYFNKHEF